MKDLSFSEVSQVSGGKGFKPVKLYTPKSATKDKVDKVIANVQDAVNDFMSENPGATSEEIVDFVNANKSAIKNGFF